MLALLYAVVAAGANVLGALAVTSRRRWSPRGLELLLGVSAGFLLSVTVLSIFPEALRRGGEVAAYVALAGFVAVHLTQHVLAAHFHFGEETHAVAPGVGRSALIGLSLHTFVDGVAIVSGFGVSGQLGILVFLAIFLHKVPEGLAISSMFLAAGATRGQALAAAAALGAATIVGALLTHYVAAISTWGLAASAGVTLYVAASNLVPELQTRRRWSLAAAFLAGCLLYVAAHALTAA